MERIAKGPARCEHWQGYWHDVADHLEMEEAGWVMWGSIRLYISRHIPIFPEYLAIHSLLILMNPHRLTALNRPL